MSSSTKAKPDGAELPPGTTLDDFLGGRITVLQPKIGHRSGSDAVWLQAAVPASAKHVCSMLVRASAWRAYAWQREAPSNCA